jgi:hypothetical protein
MDFGPRRARRHWLLRQTVRVRLGPASIVGVVPVVVLLAALAAACGAPAQAGSPQGAERAADAFLRALRDERAEDVWDHLTPATREEIHGGDFDQFAQELRTADFSGLTWSIGPVTDYEISWGVHAALEPDRAMEELVESGIAGGWGTDGIVLLVQFVADGDYLVAGQGLDTDLR